MTFGNPNNTLFLRRALQALIQSAVPIREVTLDRNAFEGLTAESRGGVYDLSCVDEHGRHFIVEMQVAYTPHFLQRLKFYAFHKLDSLVERGPFSWAALPPIYCVALLSRSILPGLEYRTVANLRTEAGELLDSQLTFVLVELDKFHVPETDLRTDLEKLIFTMQTLDEAPLDLSQYPAIWGEDWLRVAVEELSTRAMTPHQHEQYVRLKMWRMDEITAEEERQKAEAARVADRLALEAAEQQRTADQLALENAERKHAADRLALKVIEQQRTADQLALENAEQQRTADRLALEAAEQQLAATVRKLLQTGRFTLEEVASLTSSTPEQVGRWQAAS